MGVPRRRDLSVDARWTGQRRRPGVYDALPFLIANTKPDHGFGETADEPYVSMEGKRVVVLGRRWRHCDGLRYAPPSVRMRRT